MTMKTHILGREVFKVVTVNGTVMWDVTLLFRECPTFQMNASPPSPALRNK
jgi:hypothetical protein